jgi:hypothetical protein
MLTTNRRQDLRANVLKDSYSIELSMKTFGTLFIK